MPTAITLALQALSYVINLIAQLKADAAATDDQINAAALTICAGNDTLYAQMKAALTTPVPPTTGA